MWTKFNYHFPLGQLFRFARDTNRRVVGGGGHTEIRKEMCSTAGSHLNMFLSLIPTTATAAALSPQFKRKLTRSNFRRLISRSSFLFLPCKLPVSIEDRLHNFSHSTPMFENPLWEPESFVMSLKTSRTMIFWISQHVVFILIPTTIELCMSSQARFVYISHYKRPTLSFMLP